MQAQSQDTKPRWERRKDARPQELLAAALDQFVERGYAATRLEDVAKRAGVSKGTLYLYFANKEELFKAVVRENIVPPSARPSRMRPASTAIQRRTAAHVVMKLVGPDLRHQGLAGITKLMHGEGNNFPELAQFYHEEVVARGTVMIASVLERGIARGEFRPVDPAVMTQVLIAPVLMLMMWTHSFGPCDIPSIDPLAFLERLIDMALRGLLRPTRRRGQLPNNVSLPISGRFIPP
jgi:AcrR family transcriptional regulator